MQGENERSIWTQDDIDVWTREKLSFSEGQKIMHSDTGNNRFVTFASRARYNTANAGT